MFHYLDSYVQTQDKFHLDKTEHFAQKLLDLADEYHGAYFYPVPFDFPLHGNEQETMIAPWYCGIINGRILSIFARLYMVTGKEEYQKAAQKTYQSFLLLDNSEEYWITYEDENGYFWIEEYPWDPPTHVLNGFVVGIFGLYDYYLITKDDLSKHVLQASLTTLRFYIEKYRKRGELSFYCLAHKVQSLEYLKQHILFMNHVYDITGDKFFKAMADSFYADYHDF